MGITAFGFPLRIERGYFSLVSRTRKLGGGGGQGYKRKKSRRGGEEKKKKDKEGKHPYKKEEMGTRIVREGGRKERRKKGREGKGTEGEVEGRRGEGGGGGEEKLPPVHAKPSQSCLSSPGLESFVCRRAFSLVLGDPRPLPCTPVGRRSADNIS